MHGSPEESILIDRQSTPQQKVNASPLLRQSSIGAKQVRICSFLIPNSLAAVAIEIACASDIVHARRLSCHAPCSQALL